MRCNVEIDFDNDSLEKDCNDLSRLVKRHNVKRAKLIRRRLDDLRAARSLDVMRALPGRCHELLGDRALQLSLDLDGPYRLILRPRHNPVPVKADGGLDWTKVTELTVVEVVDTHD